MTTTTNPTLFLTHSNVLDSRYRDLEPQAGSIGFSSLMVKGVNEQERTVEAVVSSGDIDRYGEIVDPNAFDQKTIDAFMVNPVCLASHQHSGNDGQPTVVGLS